MQRFKATQAAKQVQQRRSLSLLLLLLAEDSEEEEEEDAMVLGSPASRWMSACDGALSLSWAGPRIQPTYLRWYPYLLTH